MKLNGIDLNKLNIFCAVLRHGGYKGASEELSITRSAISQALSSFEGTLGKNLFHRVGNKMSPTADAQRFYFEILKYQENLQSSVDILLGEQKKVEGLLRVGAYLEFAKSKLMPAIEDFLMRHPQVQIKFTFDSPSRLETLLEQNRIDLSISIFPHKERKSTISKKLYQEELVLIAKRGLLSEKPSRDSIKNTPIIDYFPDHLLFKRWWKTHFSGAMPKVFIRSYAATADMVLELAKRGQGVGVVPRYVLASDELSVIQPTSSKLYDYVWLNEAKSLTFSPAHQAFARVLRERFLGIS